MLLAEDLMLLLMDDEKGRLAAAAHARPLFGGALLVELALAGSVRLGEKRGFWQSAKVAPTSDTPSDRSPARAGSGSGRREAT